MPNRLSTAEILAAARAADGKRRGAASTAATKRSKVAAGNSQDGGGGVAIQEIEEASPREPVVIAASNGHASVAPPQTALMIAAIRSQPNGTALVHPFPPSVATMLASIHSQPNGVAAPASIPPSVATMFAAIRGEDCHRSAPAAPLSVAGMLADVRGVAQPIPIARNTHTGEDSQLDSPPAVNGKPHGRTTDILAAARRQGAVGSGKSLEKPTRKPASATADILAAARRQGAAGASKPSGNSRKKAASPAALNGSQPPKRTTADILAAARNQGAAKGTSRTPTPNSVSAKSKPPRQSRQTAGIDNITAPAKAAADNRPQPSSIAKILTAVRCGSAGETAPWEYPPLGEMVVQMRGVSDRYLSPRSRPILVDQSWATRVRNWFRWRGDRIAVRQFDQS